MNHLLATAPHTNNADPDTLNLQQKIEKAQQDLDDDRQDVESNSRALRRKLERRLVVLLSKRDEARLVQQRRKSRKIERVYIKTISKKISRFS